MSWEWNAKRFSQRMESIQREISTIDQELIRNSFSMKRSTFMELKARRAALVREYKNKGYQLRKCIPEGQPHMLRQH